MLTFTDEEINYLLSDINRVVEIFEYTHKQVRDYYYDNKSSFLKELFKEKLDYNTFMEDAKNAYSYGYCLSFASIMKSFFADFTYIGNDMNNHILLEYENNHIDIRGILENKLSDEELEEERFKYVDDSYVSYAKNNFRKLPDELYNEIKKMFYYNLKEYLKVSMEFEKYVK